MTTESVIEMIITEIKRFDHRGGLGFDVHKAMEQWVGGLEAIRAARVQAPVGWHTELEGGYCTCGKIVKGDEAIAKHNAMHKSKGHAHHFMTDLCAEAAARSDAAAPVAWLIYDKLNDEHWTTASKWTADDYVREGAPVRPLYAGPLVEKNARPFGTMTSLARDEDAKKIMGEITDRACEAFYGKSRWNDPVKLGATVLKEDVRHAMRKALEAAGVGDMLAELHDLAGFLERQGYGADDVRSVIAKVEGRTS